MKAPRWMKRISKSSADVMPHFLKQAQLAITASEAIVKMLQTTDVQRWRELSAEVKNAETQGDNILSILYEELAETALDTASKADLQRLAGFSDDFLDSLNGTAKSLLLYKPDHFDSQIVDMANCLKGESEALLRVFGYMGDGSYNVVNVSLECDRITEMEHEADQAYEDYIGTLFSHKMDAVDIIRYKNIAEMFEGTSDSAKTISDHIRQMVLRYINS